MDVKELVDTLTYKQSEIKAKTLFYTLSHVNCKALLYTLVKTLAEVQVAKFKDTRCDVKGLAIVDVLVYMLGRGSTQCGESHARRNKAREI